MLIWLNCSLSLNRAEPAPVPPLSETHPGGGIADPQPGGSVVAAHDLDALVPGVAHDVGLVDPPVRVLRRLLIGQDELGAPRPPRRMPPLQKPSVSTPIRRREPLPHRSGSGPILGGAGGSCVYWPAETAETDLRGLYETVRRRWMWPPPGNTGDREETR